MVEHNIARALHRDSFAEAECTKNFRQLQFVVLIPHDGVSTGQRGVDG